MRKPRVLGALGALRALRALGALSVLGTLALVSCDDDVVAPTTGSLEVRISGLLAGTAASATVTGPGGFSRAVTETVTIADLPLGAYTIAAAEVTALDSRWTPTPVTQSLEITGASRTAVADIAYAVSTARLAVNITGLPSGTNAGVTVTGPGSYTNTLTSSTAINLLAPGAYTVTAADVVAGGTTYRPAPTTQTIQLPPSTTQVAANVVYSAVTGSLAVTIDGLPGGVNAAVAVTGPAGFTQQLTASQTLTGLAPGTYTIAASSVDRPDGRWSPTPATQAANVTAGATVAATLTYALVTARLMVTITGLPNGVNASVSVEGPGGFSRAITATTTLDMLTPGAYTLIAGSVTSGVQTYDPAPRTQTIDLAPSTTPLTATVTYGAGTGSLVVTINGLSGGSDAAVTVTGPSGYNQQLTGTQTLTPLPPGNYTIAATPVASNLTTHTPAPATQTVNVTAGATASGTVTYTATALVLGVQEVAMGLASPVYLTAPADDSRLFIVEQAGRIRVYKNGALLAAPFLDISALVLSGGEQGLLSMAFDPAYATTGRFYVYYTNLNGDIAVARYTAAPTSDVADATSRQTVITIPHPVYGNHNGGLLMFGPDGMLYLATGDGGGGGDPSNNAQNINSLLGKMLRIDVSSLPYAIPATNPYAGATAGADEIWARGLRNPWRYGFDPPAGTLYIADVGQNEWEEVNAVAAATAGVNYGWRIMEGSHCYEAALCNGVGLRVPVLEYSHAGTSCSITGGFVYRGAAIPELTGHYLYSDYCAGFLRSFRLSGDQALDQRTWSIGTIGNILSFGRDAAGEIYMLSSNGRVYRVVRQ